MGTGKNTPVTAPVTAYPSQHGSCDAPGALRSGRCPDAHPEGRHQQGIRDSFSAIMRGLVGDPAAGNSLNVDQCSCSLDTSRVPMTSTYDIQHRRDDTAAEQDLSYHPSPLCPWVFSISMTQVA